MTHVLIGRCSRCHRKEIIALQQPRICVWCLQTEDVPPRGNTKEER